MSKIQKCMFMYKYIVTIYRQTRSYTEWLGWVDLDPAGWIACFGRWGGSPFGRVLFKDEAHWRRQREWTRDRTGRLVYKQRECRTAWCLASWCLESLWCRDRTGGRSVRHRREWWEHGSPRWLGASRGSWHCPKDWCPCWKRATRLSRTRETGRTGVWSPLWKRIHYRLALYSCFYQPPPLPYPPCERVCFWSGIWSIRMWLDSRPLWTSSSRSSSPPTPPKWAGRTSRSAEASRGWSKTPPTQARTLPRSGCTCRPRRVSRTGGRSTHIGRSAKGR